MNATETPGRAEAVRDRAARHAALGDPVRLRIVDELRVGDRSPGELRALLDVSATLLSHHLGALERVGLVSRTRSEGDARRSYVRLRAAAFDGLLSPGAPPQALRQARRVVFVCTGNSARSPLAAALWRRSSRLPAASAGTHPARALAPGAVGTAERHGLALPARTPRALSPLRDGDLLVTLCDRAREELGAIGGVHWSVPNPGGSDHSYDEAFDEIARRVEAFAPLVSRP